MDKKTYRDATERIVGDNGRKARFHIRFMNEDQRCRHPLYFTEYKSSWNNGPTDMVCFRDSFLYAREFKSHAAAMRTLEVILKNLETGKATTLWNVGHGEVEKCE